MSDIQKYYGSQAQHRTVLLKEAVDALLIAGKDGIYVDGTFGKGGHSRSLLSRLSSVGRLIAFDKDLLAIDEAKRIFDTRFSIIHDSFSSMRSILDTFGISKISGVLLDLGLSSHQVDDPSRGFSFRLNGPLDMRMNQTCGESAEEWLSRASLGELTRVIRDYGEERFAFQIAKAFIARRKKSNHLGPLCTTVELARIIGRIVTHKNGKNPATRTFQAIRIHINQELSDLKDVLNIALSSLEKKGRLVVITFHSIEDRIVKQFMHTHSSYPIIDRRLPPMRSAELPIPPLKIIGRLFPSKIEVEMNPRARSAVMRIAERT